MCTCTYIDAATSETAADSEAKQVGSTEMAVDEPQAVSPSKRKSDEVSPAAGEQPETKKAKEAEPAAAEESNA